MGINSFGFKFTLQVSILIQEFLISSFATLYHLKNCYWGNRWQIYLPGGGGEAVGGGVVVTKVQTQIKKQIKPMLVKPLIKAQNYPFRSCNCPYLNNVLSLLSFFIIIIFFIGGSDVCPRWHLSMIRDRKIQFRGLYCDVYYPRILWIN